MDKKEIQKVLQKAAKKTLQDDGVHFEIVFEKQAEEIVKFVVSQQSGLACSDTYHKHCYLSTMQYKFCPMCGVNLKQACG